MIQYRAMKLHNWNQMDAERLNPLLFRKAIHARNMTVVQIELRKYAIVPEHSHENEQITMLQRGALRFFMEGREITLHPGDLLEIPPHAPHKVEALEDSIAIDLFAPRREDWIRGDDAYLRVPTEP
jgi:quercetin dioxygenase-like cupin family protein